MKTKGLFTKAAALMACLCCVISLAACGGGGKSEELESRTDKYGNTLVTIMVHKDSSTKEGKAYQKCVDEFNAEYKSKKIKEIGRASWRERVWTWV